MAAGVVLTLAGCVAGGERQATAPAFEAEIRRTAYGVPHIKADDYAGLGYGIGYASAQDNICELAERTMRVSGERAKHKGPGENGENIASDFYHRRLIESGALDSLLNGPADSPDTPSQAARDLARGYAAGVSRYVRETGVETISDPRCQGADWVREISETDYWRSVLAGQVVIQMGGIVAAAPPGDGDGNGRQAVLDDPLPEAIGIGSNAYGLGGDMTKGGRGVLLGNPHYPWDGQNRFYRIHLTIPGELNVVGAGLITSAFVGIGHTDSIAWTHTVSTARRFGYFELSLDPEDPTRYLYEGEYVPMERQTVTVDVKGADGLRQETRTFYATRYGPVLETETLPWTAERAYAIRVMPVGLRPVDQYIALWQADSVRDLETILGRFQATGFNTTATDSSGEALFGDLGMVPNVTPGLIEACAVSPLAKGMWTRFRVPVLDGSRAACDWITDPEATAPGVFAPSDLPKLFRRDFVAQSNDSHWLTNPAARLEGFSPVLGDEENPRSLRTRLALDQIRDRMDGSDGLAGTKFDLVTLKAVMFGNRHLGGELLRDDMVTLCQDNQGDDLPGAVCDALAAWDLRVDLDSRGAHIFTLFALNGGVRFADAFDPDAPIDTPRALDTGAPEVLAALKAAAKTLKDLAIAPDAALGSVQVETRNGERIPIHGGLGTAGVFNMIIPEDVEPALGWTSVRHGSSWVMVVEFTEDGPISEGLLTYSQSTNPNSPHYSDQTRLFSRKGWDDLRFTEEAVKAGTVDRVVISE